MSDEPKVQMFAVPASPELNLLMSKKHELMRLGEAEKDRLIACQINHVRDALKHIERNNIAEARHELVKGSEHAKAAVERMYDLNFEIKEIQRKADVLLEAQVRGAMEEEGIPPEALDSVELRETGNQVPVVDSEVPPGTKVH